MLHAQPHIYLLLTYLLTRGGGRNTKWM